MKVRYAFRLLLIAFLPLFLLQCGSSSEDKNGTELVIESIVPMNDNVETTDVDVFQDVCPDGSYEKFVKHTARVVIENRLQPGVQSQDAGWVKITRYQVRYIPLDSAMPQLPTIVFNSSGTLIGPGETSSIEIQIVPLSIKFQIQKAMINAGKQYDVVYYDAEVTVWGKTQYGDYLSATQSVTLNFADFDYCSNK